MSSSLAARREEPLQIAALQGQPIEVGEDPVPVQAVVLELIGHPGMGVAHTREGVQLELGGHVEVVGVDHGL